MPAAIRAKPAMATRRGRIRALIGSPWSKANRASAPRARRRVSVQGSTLRARGPPDRSAEVADLHGDLEGLAGGPDVDPAEGHDVRVVTPVAHLHVPLAGDDVVRRVHGPPSAARHVRLDPSVAL